MPGFTILATAAAVGDMAASSSSDKIAPVQTQVELFSLFPKLQNRKPLMNI